MEPVTAWIILIVAGLVLGALSVFLIRKWNRENRRLHPERATGRAFEINREPRDR